MITIFPRGSRKVKGVPSGSQRSFPATSGRGAGDPETCQIFAYGKLQYPFRMLLHCLEPSSCFTKHWPVLMLSTLIQFGFLTKKGDIEAIEKVQKRATKLVISFKNLPYKERLLQLNLHTLKYRRLRGDMIEVYKIKHDMYDRSVALELPRNVSSTRANKYKLQNHSFHYNFRKFSIAARVVNVWNSLPDHVVDVNSLKL